MKMRGEGNEPDFHRYNSIASPLSLFRSRQWLLGVFGAWHWQCRGSGVTWRCTSGGPGRCSDTPSIWRWPGIMNEQNGNTIKQGSLGEENYSEQMEYIDSLPMNVLGKKFHVFLCPLKSHTGQFTS
jgi:hypothetical protein